MRAEAPPAEWTLEWSVAAADRCSSSARRPNPEPNPEQDAEDESPSGRDANTHTQPKSGNFEICLATHHRRITDVSLVGFNTRSRSTYHATPDDAGSCFAELYRGVSRRSHRVEPCKRESTATLQIINRDSDRDSITDEFRRKAQHELVRESGARSTHRDAPDPPSRHADSARQSPPHRAPPQASRMLRRSRGTSAALMVDQKARMTMVKSSKKLSVNKQTIRVLGGQDLEGVAGGWIRPKITWSCPQPSASSANCPAQEL